MSVNKKLFWLIYFLGFLLAVATALPSYIQSSFLAQFVTLEHMGWYVFVANMFTLLAIFVFPKFIKLYSNYRVMLFLLGLNFLTVILLIRASQPYAVLFCYVIVYVSLILLSINLDIFLENISDDEHTGRIRTTFLTIMNLGWVMSPLLMGYLTGEGNRYWLVYLASGIVLVPVAVILFTQRGIMIDHIKYRNRHIKDIMAIMKSRVNLRKIFSITFTLRFFYSLMVLYVPVYLHETIGFSWGELGIMFTVMLLPFVIFELPAGNLADRYLGEKEIMVTGFLIMMLTVGSIFFIKSDSFFVWTVLLFMTRVGAALVEAMQEAYFFKKVDSSDMDLINLFRDINPAAWLVGSLASVLVLKFLSLPHLFLLLALVILVNLRPALTLEDTK